MFFLSNLTCAKVNKAKGTLRNSPQLDDVHVVLEKEGDNKQVPDYVGTKLLMSRRTSRRRNLVPGPLLLWQGRQTWKRVGHALRKQTINVTKQALDRNPQRKRKTGRLNTAWRRSIAEEVKKHGTSWKEMKKAANNRVCWKRVVSARCSTLNEED